MKKQVLMAAFLLMFNVQAWNTKVEFETAMIRALRDKWYLISDGFKTNLLAFIQSPTDTESLFEARIVQTMMNNEQYIHDMDFAKLEREYVEATNFVATAQVATNSWCSWGLPLSLSAYYGNYGDNVKIFNLATNIIDRIGRHEIGVETNAVSQAYLVAHEMENVTPLQAIKTFAVVAEQLAFNEIVQTTVYTNNLPTHIMDMLRKILGN